MLVLKQNASLRLVFRPWIFRIFQARKKPNLRLQNLRFRFFRPSSCQGGGEFLIGFTLVLLGTFEQHWLALDLSKVLWGSLGVPTKITRSP
jgi:hypothetical protein